MEGTVEVSSAVEVLEPVFERVRLLFRRYVLALRPHELRGQEGQEIERKILHFLSNPELELERREVLRGLEGALGAGERWELEGRVSPGDESAAATLVDVQAALRLGEVARDLLWVLLVPELAPRYLWMYRAVTGQPQQLAWPEAFLTALVDPLGAQLGEVRRELSLEGGLVRFGLVQVREERSGTPDAVRLYRLDERAREHLLCRIDPTTPERFRVLHPKPSAEGLGEFTAEVQRAARRVMRGRRRMLLIGVANAGAGQLASELQAGLGLPLVRVKASELMEQGEGLMTGVLRETLLQRAGVWVEEVEAMESERFTDWQVERLLDGLGCVKTGLFVSSAPVLSPRTRLRLMQRLEVEEIHLPSPTLEAREGRWRRVLEGETLGAPLESLVAQARVYPLALEDIPAAGQLARASAAERSPGAAVIDLKDIEQACSALNSPKLRELATRVRAVASWDDVVLPEATMEAIQDLLSYARHADVVLNQWGFGRKVSYGLGLSAMLSGPSGTGKTMLSGLIARELGKELYRIDLSKIVSKYIGETEQHLAILFEEAKAGDVALLFDEADSLFAKRTEVKSSVDRYANLETNFLLQKIEEFEGLILLTTNFPESIDEAFMRRLKFKIYFPQPDLEQRAELWRAMIPSSAPQEGAIDFKKLALRFELTGGQIRNAVFRAALYAADAGTGLRFEDLDRAARSVYREEGRLVFASAAAGTGTAAAAAPGEGGRAR